MPTAHTSPRTLPAFLREFPLVLGFAVLLSFAIGILNTMETRFMLAGIMGIGLIAALILAPNKRMFVVSLVTFSLIVNTNKRLLIFPGIWNDPTRYEAIFVSATDVLVLLGCAVWFFSSFRDSKRAEGLGPHSLTKPFFALFFACLLSLIKTDHVNWGVAELFRMLKAFLLYWYMANNIRTKKEVRWVLACLAFGIIIQFCVSVLQRFVFQGSLGMKYLGESSGGVESTVGEKQVLRVGGTLGHPNHFAYYLDLLAPLMLALAFSEAFPEWMRIFYGLTFMASVVSLYLTLSRGGWVATAISLTGLFAVLMARNLKQRIFRGRTWAVLAVVLITAVAFQGTILERFTKNDAGALSTRFYQYEVSAKIARKNPIFGIGLNNFRNVSINYDDTAKQITHSFKMPVHNVYFLALTETGIVGLIALGWFVFAVLNLAWFKRWDYGESFTLHAGFFFGFLGYFIHANADINPISSYTFLFFLLGLLTAIHRMGKTEMTVSHETLRLTPTEAAS